MTQLTKENLTKEIDLKCLTVEEMCKVIFLSGHVKGKPGQPDPTSWEDIYNYSPRGELYMIYYWYIAALVYLGYKEIADFLIEKDEREMKEWATKHSAE